MGIAFGEIVLASPPAYSIDNVSKSKAIRWWLRRAISNSSHTHLFSNPFRISKSSKAFPAPTATAVIGSSAIFTGSFMTDLKNESIFLSKAPPPASIIPFSKRSDASSGGVRSRIVNTAPEIAFSGSEIASLISPESIVKTFGTPLVRSLPFTSTFSKFSSGYALPIVIFTVSAVLNPITKRCFLLMYSRMDSSILSPATRKEILSTMPPSERTATSVVPPPISTIMLPLGSDIGSPAPIAAASGSSIKCTSLAPANPADSRTALFST